MVTQGHGCVALLDEFLAETDEVDIAGAFTSELRVVERSGRQSDLYRRAEQFLRAQGVDPESLKQPVKARFRSRRRKLQAEAGGGSLQIVLGEIAEWAVVGRCASSQGMVEAKALERGWNTAKLLAAVTPMSVQWFVVLDQMNKP